MALIIKANNDSFLPKIVLGRLGEKNARSIRFDISDWISDYGKGSVQLIHQRSQDETPYPVAVKVSGSVVIWNVTLTDTAHPGEGKCELRYYVDDAEGQKCTASGLGAHAEGVSTTASGNYSHAEGFNTTASSQYAHVQGRYNVLDTAGAYAHIVGNGSASNTRSNAHTLDWSGNAWYAGSVECTALILTSSTEGSDKRFVITVDDAGVLTATAITV